MCRGVLRSFFKLPVPVYCPPSPTRGCVIEPADTCQDWTMAEASDAQLAVLAGFGLSEDADCQTLVGMLQDCDADLGAMTGGAFDGTLRDVCCETWLGVWK